MPTPPLHTTPPIVLVVDDHPINRLVLVRAVEAFGGVAHAAENGREALAKIESAPFDLIFMDIAMPVLDGEEATREVRLRGLQTPIVAVTAQYGACDLPHLSQIGFTAIIPKPIELQAVFAQIAAAQGSARTEPRG